MRLVFLTQNDPFYLPKIYQYLLPKLRENGHNIVSMILFDVAPFGKKKSKLSQFIEAYKIFGFSFCLFYIMKYLNSFFKTSISKVMKNHNVKVIKLKQGVNHSSSLKIISQFKSDLLISLAGNEIFKKPLFNTSKYGVINLHSALLPKYRGLMPSFWVLCNNERKTGVSVFFVDEGIDSGPIIIQKELNLTNQTQEELIWQLKFLGADAILEACNLISINGVNTPTLKNSDMEMTYFSKPKRQDVNKFKSNGKKFY